MHDEPAGFHLVGRLQKEVIVDVRLVLVVLRVEHGNVAKRHVAGNQIEEIIGRLELLERLRFGIRGRVKHFEDRARGGVFLDRGRVRFAGEFGRHHSQVIAHAGGRFEKAPALEPESFRHLPVGIHDAGMGVVRVEGGVAGGSKFILAEKGTEFFAFFLPLVRGEQGVVFVGGKFVAKTLTGRVVDLFVADVEQGGELSPTQKLGQDLLFLRGRTGATLGFDVFQDADGSDVLVELGFGSALEEIAVGITPVPRR